MMIDNFKEDLVVARSNVLNNILYALCWVLVVVFALYGMLMMQVVMFAFDIPSVLLTIFSIAAAAFLFFAKDNFRV